MGGFIACSGLLDEHMFCSDQIGSEVTVKM